MSGFRFYSATYYGFWTLFIAAFVVIGAREVWIGSRGQFLAPAPYASTDAYLEALLHVSNASERCTETIGRLNPKHGVLFFCPRRDAEGDFIYSALAYLTWPQQMRKVTLDRADLGEIVASLEGLRTSALIFCRLKPPPEFPHGWRIGPNLFIVPIEGGE